MDDELKLVLRLIGVILFIVAIGIGVTAIQDKYEVKAFNKIHETDYTFGDWFWAKNTIKDYHLGTVENKNYQVDLNLKDERLKGGES